MSASSASASDSWGLNSTGGNLNVNQPNYIAWVVVALVVVIAAYLWKKGKF